MKQYLAPMEIVSLYELYRIKYTKLRISVQPFELKDFDEGQSWRDKECYSVLN